MLSLMINQAVSCKMCLLCCMYVSERERVGACMDITFLATGVFGKLPNTPVARKVISMHSKQMRIKRWVSKVCRFAVCT